MCVDFDAGAGEPSWKLLLEAPLGQGGNERLAGGDPTYSQILMEIDAMLLRAHHAGEGLWESGVVHRLVTDGTQRTAVDCWHLVLGKIRIDARVRVIALRGAAQDRERQIALSLLEPTQCSRWPGS